MLLRASQPLILSYELVLLLTAALDGQEGEVFRCGARMGTRTRNGLNE